MSPDGQWVWNGQQWLPVAKEIEVTANAVFPAWNSVAVERAQTTAPVVAGPPVQMQAPVPVILPAITYELEEAVPPWEQRTKSRKLNFIYLAGAIVAIMVAIVFVRSMGPIAWPWVSYGSDTVRVVPSPTPPPLATRSDFALADRFANGWLAPAVSGLNQALGHQREICNGTLSFSCQDAVNATDLQIQYALAVIDRQAYPTCIAGPVAKLKLDLTGLDGAAQSILKAYTDNSRTELAQALAHFAAVSRPLSADTNAVDNAPKASCSAQLTGP
jgi:hypothetical protein